MGHMASIESSLWLGELVFMVCAAVGWSVISCMNFESRIILSVSGMANIMENKQLKSELASRKAEYSVGKVFLSRTNVLVLANWCEAKVSIEPHNIIYVQVYGLLYGAQSLRKYIFFFWMFCVSRGLINVTFVKIEGLL